MRKSLVVHNVVQKEEIVIWGELWFSNRTLRLCRFKLILSEHNGSKPKLSEHNSSTEQCYAHLSMKCYKTPPGRKEIEDVKIKKEER